MSITVPGDSFALDEFHHQIWRTIFIRAAIEQARNVRVFEIRENLPLVTKKLCAPPRKSAVDQLDRDSLFVGVVGANRAIHASHSAASDFCFQPIRADSASDCRLNESRGREIGAELLGKLFEMLSFSGFMRSQQIFQVETQVCVVTARAVEER